MESGAGLRLELFALDMEASIAFYTRVLAFELARHEPGDYASLHLGDVVLGVGPVAKLPEEGGYFGRDIATLRRALGAGDRHRGGRRRRVPRPCRLLGPPDTRASPGPSVGAQGLQNLRPRSV